MKLFVDDFRPAPPGWAWAKDVSTAIRMMDTMPIEAVALDHDIGGSTETFEAVARHLAVSVQANKIPGTLPIYIHTGNPVGGQRMMDILTESGCKDVQMWLYDSYFDSEDRFR